MKNLEEYSSQDRNGSLIPDVSAHNKNGEFTELWHMAREGNRQALERLTEMITPELLEIARRLMSRERKNHTLSASELMSEAYLRLLNKGLITIQDRHHFLAIAATRMRYILIDYARRRNSKGNNNGVKPDTLNEEVHDVPSDSPSISEFIDLDNALNELEKIHEGWARVVELRYFGGCTFKEVAEILEIHQRRAERYWERARTWLFNYLKENR